MVRCTGGRGTVGRGTVGRGTVGRGTVGEDGGQGNAGSGQAGADAVGTIDLGGGLGKPEPLAKWTVFVYGHADHNLSNSFVRDLVEMARAELSDDVQVIVLADFDASQELADSGERFPAGAEWLRIPGGSQEPESPPPTCRSRT